MSFQKISSLMVLFILSATVLLASTPPGLVNYQGILRDNSDQPLSGTFDMVFHFYDAPSGGSLLLSDSHTAGGAVNVINGLFDVALGSGSIIPGSESTIAGVFQNHEPVYVEIEISSETLSPRIRLIPSGYALNSASLEGMTSSSFAAASHTHPGSDITSPVANANNADLLDGLNSTSFAMSVHTHPGSDITSPVANAANADNANLLDGIDSTGFATASHTHSLLTAGNGLSGGSYNGGSPITFALGNLTSDWNMTNAFDVVLNNASSELRIASSNGGAFGTFDVGSLGSNQTYTFTTGGTMWSSGNDGAGSTLDADLLDGLNSTSFAAASHTHPGSDITSPVANANNADLLDGLNSTAFALSSHTHSATDITSGTLSSTRGGTGSNTSSAPTGSLLRTSSTGVWSALNPGADGQLLIMSGGTPVWQPFIGVTGSGNQNFLPKFIGPNTIGNSLITENVNQILIGTTVPSSFLFVNGSGLFQDPNGNGFGITAKGNQGGGYFQDLNASGYAQVGNADIGISSYGNEAGGYFKDLDHSGYAYVGWGDFGVVGYGIFAGGAFLNTDGSSNAYVGYYGAGINASGNFYGGLFSSQDIGVVGYGYGLGGFFQDNDSSGYASVGSDTYKIQGNGSVAFVQNHPTEKDKVIVYNAPESDEVATYNRGTARLVDGIAHVRLGETFAWVTNPDLGLTAYVTPRGAWSDLYVEAVSPTELIVRSKGGTGNGVFDYIVYGLRIGFEEVSIVQEKTRDSFIPSMASHRTAYQKHPELQQYNAFERFGKMRSSIGETQPVDLSASTTLKNAIHEFDPSVDKVETPDVLNSKDIEKLTARDTQVKAPVKTPSTQATAMPLQKPVATPRQSQSDAEGNFYATSFRSASDEVAKSMPVVQQVSLGDVVVVDRVNHGWLKLADMPADPGVVGVISAAPGVLLGAEKDSAKAPVALSGIVKCKVDANHGAIQIGDLLTTSSTSGYAMRAEQATPGTIIGKAMESLDSGTGLIEILIMHQ